ncbi:hypothetical protein BC332_13870 [Capsicum chinense]|nr:hypothetical protein BC332_13870 [Capsicum chinense]
MEVAEVVIMGAWEEGPNCWSWKSSTKKTLPIPLHHNGSYDDMVRAKEYYVAADGSRLLLRINIISGSPTIPPPQPIINEDDSFEDESLDANPMDLKDDSMELEDPIFFKEGGEECELGAQTNHLL